MSSMDHCKIFDSMAKPWSSWRWPAILQGRRCDHQAHVLRLTSLGKDARISCSALVHTNGMQCICICRWCMRSTSGWRVLEYPLFLAQQHKSARTRARQTRHLRVVRICRCRPPQRCATTKPEPPSGQSRPTLGWALRAMARLDCQMVEGADQKISLPLRHD